MVRLGHVTHEWQSAHADVAYVGFSTPDCRGEGGGDSLDNVYTLFDKQGLVIFVLLAGQWFISTIAYNREGISRSY